MAFSTIKLALLLVFCGTSLADQCPNFTTKHNFKVEKVSQHIFSFVYTSLHSLFQYMGLWYDISRLPHFLHNNIKCDNATFTLNPNGSVTIVNRGVDLQGQPIGTIDLARVIDPAFPAAFALIARNSKCTFPCFTSITKIIFLVVVGAHNVLATDYKCYASIYACSILPNTGVKIEFGFIFS